MQRNGVLGKGALRLQLAMLRATTRQVQLRSMVERMQEELMAMNDRQYKQVSMEYMKKRHGLVSAVSTTWVPWVPGVFPCLHACNFQQRTFRPSAAVMWLQHSQLLILSHGKWLQAIILAEPAFRAKQGRVCHEGLASNSQKPCPFHSHARPDRQIVPWA